MSRTKKKLEVSSPVSKYLTFSGTKGQIKYYDTSSSKADSKGNVYLESLNLAILDIKASISGYNESSASSVTSNLLNPYDVNKDKFIVKTKINGKYSTFAEGGYSEIKDKLKNVNGKFTINIFGACDLGEGYQIVRLDLSGSSLGSWLDFRDKKSDEDLYNSVVSIAKGDLCKREKGKTVKVSDKEYKDVTKALKEDPLAERPVWFYIPSITSLPITDEFSQKANDLDEKLQEYFDTLLLKPNQDDSNKIDEDKDEEDVTKEVVGISSDDLPF